MKKTLIIVSEQYLAEQTCSAARERPLIQARCELYACRDCRTKTGWPHRYGCTLFSVTDPGCGECRYWSEKKEACGHPAVRRGGAHA